MAAWSSDSIIIRAPSEIKAEFNYKPFSKDAVNQTTLTFFNRLPVSRLTNSINELGGINQECRTFLENIGQHHVEQIHLQLDGEDMGEYGYVKQNHASSVKQKMSKIPAIFARFYNITFTIKNPFRTSKFSFRYEVFLTVNLR